MVLRIERQRPASGPPRSRGRRRGTPRGGHRGTPEGGAEVRAWWQRAPPHGGQASQGRPEVGDGGLQHGAQRRQQRAALGRPAARRAAAAPGRTARGILPGGGQPTLARRPRGNLSQDIPKLAGSSALWARARTLRPRAPLLVSTSTAAGARLGEAPKMGGTGQASPPGGPREPGAEVRQATADGVAAPLEKDPPGGSLPRRSSP
ncbi:unnamed protein product [Prorocentrum cordatum]|uniref:Uncharacterized protein n=1 Tax=Prorocentrum cordatum TaxID=2364126 RepID=A0ABN9Q2F5_9DINO|nr:unnamed protein product [Polarella glacialis]